MKLFFGMRRTLSFSSLSIFLTVLVCAADNTSATARPAWTKSKIHGSPEPPAPYRLVAPFPKIRFQKPTSIEPFPGAKRLLVTEIGGKIFTILTEPVPNEADLLFDLNEMLPDTLSGRSVTLFDAEFHPKFQDNQFLFVCY